MSAPARLLKMLDWETVYATPRSTVYHRMKTDPTFPKPVRMGPRCVRWKADEVEAWIASRSNAAPAAA